MTLASALLFANAFVAAVCAIYPAPDPITLTGYLADLDTSLPGGGNLAWASRANFAIDHSHKNIEIAGPCIEMLFTTDAAGTQRPLKAGKRYTVVLSRGKPVADMIAPGRTDKNPWSLSSASR